MYFYKFSVFHDGDHSYFGFLDFDNAQLSRLTMAFRRTNLTSHLTTVRSSEDGNSTLLRNGTSAYGSISQPPGSDPVPDPGFNYTGPQEVLLEFVILVF